jgi:hypothetical protein
LTSDLFVIEQTKDRNGRSVWRGLEESDEAGVTRKKIVETCRSEE